MSQQPLRTSPAPSRMMEFLTTFVLAVPEWASSSEVDQLQNREVARARELAEEGHLLRLWMPAAPRRGKRMFGLWQARDCRELEIILASLPMRPWTAVEIIPLALGASERVGAYIPELAD